MAILLALVSTVNLIKGAADYSHNHQLGLAQIITPIILLISFVSIPFMYFTVFRYITSNSVHLGNIEPTKTTELNLDHLHIRRACAVIESSGLMCRLLRERG